MAKTRTQNMVLLAAVLLILIGFAMVVRIHPNADRVALLTTRGMAGSCCIPTVQKVLQKTEGVASVVVDPARARVIVGFDSKKTAPAKLAAAVTSAGFPSEVQMVETMEKYRAEAGRNGGTPAVDLMTHDGCCGGCCSQSRN